MSYDGLSKVISGGQTGADQAGLMAAFKVGLKTGGTAPADFYTEAGHNPLLELLGLTAEGDYRSRTIKNVKNSDGTLLLTSTVNSPGSTLTRNEALRQAKPFHQVDTSGMHSKMLAGESIHDLIKHFSAEVSFWLVSNKIKTVNVAGNREKHAKQGFITTRIVEAILLDVFNDLRRSELLRAGDF